MRRYVLIVGGIDALIWIGVIVWQLRQPKHVDIAGIHAFLFIIHMHRTRSGARDSQQGPQDRGLAGEHRCLRALLRRRRKPDFELAYQ